LPGRGHKIQPYEAKYGTCLRHPNAPNLGSSSGREPSMVELVGFVTATHAAYPSKRERWLLIWAKVRHVDAGHKACVWPIAGRDGALHQSLE
jgi:hypothetical protein